MCAIGLGGCAQEEEMQEEAGPQAVRVDVIRAEIESMREIVEGIGTLEAMETVELKAETAGLVRELNFEGGRPVEAGQVLVRLEDDELQRELDARQAALDAAREQEEIARTTFERIEELRAEGVVSAQRFDETRTELDRALAEIERLESEIALVRERIDNTVVRAPFAGIISENQVDVGDYVKVGALLATLYRVDPLKIRFTLPERYLDRIEVGQAVELKVDAYPERRFEGVVTLVAPAVDAMTRDVRVEAQLEEGSDALKPGVFARAMLVLATREPRPVIPEEALVSTREGYEVFVVEEGRAHARPVETGLRRVGRVEIVEGLEGGEWIVRQGQMRLSEGTAVERMEPGPQGERPGGTGVGTPADHATTETMPTRGSTGTN